MLPSNDKVTFFLLFVFCNLKKKSKSTSVKQPIPDCGKLRNAVNRNFFFASSEPQHSCWKSSLLEETAKNPDALGKKSLLSWY